MILRRVRPFSLAASGNFPPIINFGVKLLFPVVRSSPSNMRLSHLCASTTTNVERLLSMKSKVRFDRKPSNFCTCTSATYCSDASSEHKKTAGNRHDDVIARAGQSETSGGGGTGQSQKSGGEGPIKSTKEQEEAKKRQLKSYGDDSSINRMLLDKYRVPEPTTTAQKVKEGAKDIYYFSIFAVALVGTGAVLYYVFSELFSSNSPNSIYGRALKLVVADSRVEEILGSPIKGFGEETRRGRRRHISHMQYQKEGIKFMRMKFYVKGSQAKGIVNLEVKENEKGKFDYRYLYVDVETFPPKTIVLIDNR